jgi:DNA-binding SARP family transcriptional activator
MNAGIDVRLLGPLEVAVPTGEVEFEGAKQRRLFVALVLRAPDALSVDELVEVVWGDRPPDGRDQALQKQVSRLRARVGEFLPVRRRAAGYSLEIDRRAIDSRRFESWPADRRPIWSASCARSSPSTRCASGCAGS